MGSAPNKAVHRLDLDETEAASLSRLAQDPPPARLRPGRFGTFLVGHPFLAGTQTKRPLKAYAPTLADLIGPTRSPFKALKQTCHL